MTYINKDFVEEVNFCMHNLMTRSLCIHKNTTSFQEQVQEYNIRIISTQNETNFSLKMATLFLLNAILYKIDKDLRISPLFTLEKLSAFPVVVKHSWPSKTF